MPQIMTRVVHHEPLLPSRMKPALPRDLDVVITRALAKDPKQRYPDGHAFAEDLQDVLHSRPLRDRDGLKTLPVLEPTGGFRPAVVEAAAAPLGTRAPDPASPPRARSADGRGAGLAIGLRCWASATRPSPRTPAPVRRACGRGGARSTVHVRTALSVPPPTASQPRSEPSRGRAGAAGGRPSQAGSPTDPTTARLPRRAWRSRYITA